MKGDIVEFLASIVYGQYLNRWTNQNIGLGRKGYAVTYTYDYSTHPHYQEAVRRGLCSPYTHDTPLSERVKATIEAWRVAVNKGVGATDFSAGLVKADLMLYEIVRELKKMDQPLAERVLVRADIGWYIRFCMAKDGCPNAAWLRWAEKRGRKLFHSDYERWFDARDTIEIERQDMVRLERNRANRQNKTLDQIRTVRI